MAAGVHRAMTRVAAQAAVTVVGEVLPDRFAALARTLAELGADPAGNPRIPFARLPGVHFGRLFTTATTPRHLVYMSDVDATEEEHLASLVEVAGPGLDALFGHCAGYPEPGAATPAGRLAFLRRHRVRPAVRYINTVGRSLRQVLDERDLRDAIEAFLDRSRGTLPEDAARLRAAVRAFVASQPELAPALTPAPSPGAWWRAGQWLRLALLALVLLVLLPVLLVALPIGLALVRLHEVRDIPSSQRPDPARLAEIATYEDQCAQNPFAALSPVRPGWFRAVMLRVALRATDFLARHLYNRGALLGLRTIHFFRLVVIDGHRQLMFGSTFDGSLESYMDDFIDKLAPGLNAIFGSAVGYPRTTFVLGGGARSEQEFKDYIHVVQQPIPVFFSAYPDLTAVNVANNAAIRAGLSGPMTGAEAAAWLRRL